LNVSGPVERKKIKKNQKTPNHAAYEMTINAIKSTMKIL
jgi:hypothetical protein